ncbi:MAG: hypothetical protein A2857_06605 [Candidatus Levybacteria bacterium RIFCSPHIGHO2_01_FULL_36_15]|nr:MAG: hypothetical protein A2857_06605 [Candidatus Levybacteria bacterium RIFCSPHIGHO2_01_FULL_36_15]OGH38809.1 MAG: hypothetical protein A2905_02510 [Candidatus Levybacteria bacterium RIFCSPLOWO2_01_FULL_36_10]
MGIITTLTTFIVVSLDPVTRFAQARNSRRITDIDSILVAIQEYIVDNNGDLASTGVTTTEKQLGTCLSGGNTACSDAAADCLNLTSTLSKYLKSIPIDPNGTSEFTGYSVVTDSNNIITVTACKTEAPETTPLSVSR